MNPITRYALLLLALLCATVGTLLLSGKIQIVIVRRTKEKESESDVPEILAEPITEKAQTEPTTETPKKHSHKPSKAQPYYRYLPMGTTRDKITKLDTWLRKYESPDGRQIIFRIPTTDGSEEESRLDYLVQWNKKLGERLEAKVNSLQ